MKFVDEVKITISSGRGGPGAVTFRRESMQPRGGPDGGDGGKGGDVVIRTSKHINSLFDFCSVVHCDGSPCLHRCFKHFHVFAGKFFE